MGIEIEEGAINAAFSQPNNDGSFDGELREYLEKLGVRRPVMIFAFPPKAAGTFLRAAAVLAIQGQLVRTVYAQGGRDAQLYMPLFIRYYLGLMGDQPLVTHVHMQALPANCRFMEVFDLKPIIMIRPIRDMLASYWDMLAEDDAALQDGLNCRFPAHFRDLSSSRKADFLIATLAPWYVGYYATWLEYADANPDRVCVLNYDDFLSAPEAVLERALAHARLPRPREICRAAIEFTSQKRTQFRFNRGESGRGKDYFSWRHVPRIDELLSFYPVLDSVSDQLAR